MPQELKPCPICKSVLLTYIIANHSTKPRMTAPEDWLTAVETAARGDMAGDPEATKRLDELGPADVILRLVEMVFKK